MLQIEIDGNMVEQVMGFNYLDVNITSSENLVEKMKTLSQKVDKGGWQFELSCLEKQIYEKENKIKIYIR